MWKLFNTTRNQINVVSSATWLVDKCCATNAIAISISFRRFKCLCRLRSRVQIRELCENVERKLRETWSGMFLVRKYSTWFVCDGWKQVNWREREKDRRTQFNGIAKTHSLSLNVRVKHSQSAEEKNSFVLSLVCINPLLLVKHWSVCVEHSLQSHRKIIFIKLLSANHHEVAKCCCCVAESRVDRQLYR